MKPEYEDLLKQNGLLDENGLTIEGWELFSRLLDFVGPYPDLTPGIMPSPHGIFDKFMSRVIPVAMELILIRNKKIYLTYRNDDWWQGWHIPGGFMSPKKNLLENVWSIAEEVPGALITAAGQDRIIGTLYVFDNPRFPNFVLLMKAEFTGEPTGGKWFGEFPPDFLDVQKPYIPILNPLLSGK